ncbi:MAG: DJ-1/PfpI family protein [Gordonia sp. (in: high G+C Gram-positive bacteria)]
MRFGILIFDDVEVLDACGPFEVFCVAARLRAREMPEDSVTVTLVSAYPDRAVVVARGGLRLTADVTIADAPEFDVLVVPGGVTTEVERDRAVIAWIAARATTPTVASVCTGAFLLAAAGILRSGPVTTHWEDQAELVARHPRLTVVDGPRWVRQGSVYTSAGISAGLDLALHLVGLIDRSLPPRVARQMDYAWQERGGE